MFTHYKEKIMGFGVSTLIPNDIKNVFREDLSNDSLERLWNEIEIQGQKVLIGNLYIPPNMESHLHLLNKELKKHKGKKLILLGDCNSRHKIWDKNLTRNTKMGNILQDIIHQQNYFLLTDVDHTYHNSDLNENAGRSTIDLTLVSGLSNLHIRTRAFDLTKTRHMAIEISVNEQGKKEKRNTHFRKKNADWSIWERIRDTKLKTFKDTFPTLVNPDIIDAQTSTLTNIIIDSATDFFANTEISKRISKG